MRVTTGLGALTTGEPRSAAAGQPTYPQPIRVRPQPLPGPARWTGTAESLRRAQAQLATEYFGAERSPSQQQLDRQPVTRPAAARDLDRTAARDLDRTAARDLDRTAAGDVDRAPARDLDRTAARDVDRTAAREGSERAGADRYRGTRQWSDRSGSDHDRSGPWIERPAALYATPPRRPAGFASPPRSGGLALPMSAPAPIAPARAPRTPASDTGDPTPLFTATEYVAIGDSPLYRVVAELIAVGDGGPTTEVPEPPALSTVVTETPTAEARPAQTAEARTARPAGARTAQTAEARPAEARRAETQTGGAWAVSDPVTAAPIAYLTSAELARGAEMHGGVESRSGVEVRSGAELRSAGLRRGVEVRSGAELRRAAELRNADLRSFDGEDSYLEGGKHRDASRMAGHRPGIESVRRSAPRHRAG